VEAAKTDDPTPPLREVRLGLVFNGGISLAVWMGGVTHEIDAARRAADTTATGMTTTLYRELLCEHLQQTVRVDVISGASAGGINGSLLAAAIAAGKPVPDLRETWLVLGDLATLMRSPAQSDPPSWLQGDEIVLAAVQRELELLIGASSIAPADVEAPIYLYVSATNLRGRENVYRDATGRQFTETDSRHMFAFELLPEQLLQSRRHLDRPDRWPERSARPTSFAHPAAAQRLAGAARASSSFPGAFEAAGPFGPQRDWFIDGGVLDNQPFVPLLDRIAILPAEGGPVKRVVGYVVPSLSVARPAADADWRPSAMSTLTATVKAMSGLSKLISLDRLVGDGERQRAEDAQRRLVHELMIGRDADLSREGLESAAGELFEAYRHARALAGGETFARWLAPAFVAGDGRLGQNPTIAVDDMTSPEVGVEAIDPADAGLWIPARCGWSRHDPQWCWGLSPAERVATMALLIVRELLEEDPQDAMLRLARKLASQLVWDLRALAQQLSERFPRDDTLKLADRAQRAYGALEGPGDLDGLRWLQRRFVHLDFRMDKARSNGHGLPTIATLLHVEVVRNALRIDRQGPPFPFDFVAMSSAVRENGQPNSALGHPSITPDDKLAGMKLGHFGAFVKRSWRANDWLWGRVDGVVHVLRATVDEQLLAQHRDRVADLAGFAFAGGDVLGELWKRNVELVKDLAPEGDAGRQFAAVFERALGGDVTALEVIRAALAAPIQLQILRDELEDVAAAAEADVEKGASRAVAGATWARDLRAEQRRAGKSPLGDEQLVALFGQMRIGEETIGGELLSASGLDVVARTGAVTTAILSGGRGGLPAVVRGGLRGLRAATLALSYGVRLVVRKPAVGLVALLVLAQLTYFAVTPTARGWARCYRRS